MFQTITIQCLIWGVLSAFVPLFFSLSSALWGQSLSVRRMEPPFWWVGMKNPSLQLLVYGDNIGKTAVKLNSPSARLKGVVKTANPNYVFVNLEIPKNAKPGQLQLFFTDESGAQARMFYQLHAKSADRSRAQGFDASDVIYMLMPDRFANGDPKNDRVSGMPDEANRDTMHARHGGDLQGVISRLDYFKSLGVTAIWSTPLLENNMAKYSYHGYAITDFYKIDARFGQNDLYKQYVEKAHTAGLKVVKDMVLNHCGTEHWFIKDPPAPDWAHYLEDFRKNPNWKKEYPQGNFRASTVSDPHASDFDRDMMTNTWFDWTMADLNQQNPLLATYLIQNTLWWIEYAGIDGIRMDTYPYSDKTFTARWAKAVRDEYPRFGIVGEVWMSEPALTAYWQSNARNKDGYVSHLPSVTDFPLNYALAAAFNEKTTWDGGLMKLYNAVASDFLYEDPSRNIIFLDNHDLTRYFTTVGEDARKWKMGLALLLTMRGVPQIYYGTEILMAGEKNPDHLVRKDFPGGWAGDAADAFSGKGLSDSQREAQEYARKLLNWRKNKPVLHSGKLRHFLPHDEVYTYFRYDETTGETVMTLLNNHDSDARAVNTARYKERLAGFSRARNVVTGEALSDISTLNVPAKSAVILELLK